MWQETWPTRRDTELGVNPRICVWRPRVGTLDGGSTPVQRVGAQMGGLLKRRVGQMRQARFIARASLAILLTLAIAPAAAIAAPATTMALSPASGPATAEFRVSLKRLPANESIIINWDEIQIGRGSADSRGSLILILNVPKTATPGVHDVRAIRAEGGDVSHAPFLVQTDWLQFHADEARTGANPFENLLSPANVNGIIVYDSHATGGPITGSALACDGHVVVGSTDGSLHGFVPGGFTEPWLFQTRGPITATPAAVPIDPCLIVAGSGDGTVYALDAATGKQKWKSTGGSPITSPVLLYTFDPQPDPPGRFIVVGDESGQVRALDLRGRRLWAAQLDGSIAGAAAWHSVPVDPMITQLDPGSRIFVTTRNGSVYGLDPSTGAVLIAIRLGSEIAAGPAVTLGQQGPPIPDAPIAVIGTADGVLHALFADDLSEKWSFRTGGPITTTPAIGDAGIFVASGDGSVYGLRETETGVEAAWTTVLGAGLDSSPALASGVVYLCAGDSSLRALDAIRGEVLFTSEAITCKQSSPIVVDGKVTIGTGHGEVITFYLPL